MSPPSSGSKTAAQYETCTKQSVISRKIELRTGKLFEQYHFDFYHQNTALNSHKAQSSAL
jgi:hypothetical protein